jgi:FkbM family methyltransferase
VTASRLRYRLRRLAAHSAPRALDSALAPCLFGFHRDGSAIDDVADGLRVRYERHSIIGERLFLFGGFESNEVAYAAQRLARQAAPVVFDIGANIGWHTLNWARAVPEAAVYAFEPSPATAAVLRRNVTANGFTQRVEIVEVAMADTVGKARFFECADSAYSSVKDTGRSPVARQLEVACTTLDRFVTERGVFPHLIKIDVEGLEHEVVTGGRQCLSERHPDVLVEIYGGSNSNTNPAATVSLLQSIGYRAFTFVNGALQPYVRHVDEQYNYFFCPDAA